jgi:arylsulfatase
MTTTMGRRDFLRATGLAAAAWSAPRLANAADGLAGRRPNIVLIMTDDQGYADLACHGNPILKTPNLDKLHGESLRFTDFHVSPTCAPTRCSIMTGRHEFRSGITHTILERERMSLKAFTLPQALKSAGYTTGIFGKWHLGDEAPYQPEKRGFDEVFIHGAGGIGQSYPGSCGDAPGNTYFDPVIRHNGRFVRTKGFCTDVFFGRAASWIESRKGKGPFFAYITPNAPHGPYHAPESYRARFKGKVPQNIEGFYGMIENIDDNVGRLRAKLAELGVERETLFIFMTDNGSAAGSRIFNAGMRGAKGSPWNGGTRVPLFLHWPGVLQPADCDRLAAHIDLFPTFAALAGAEVPAATAAGFDGRSLVPLLANPAAPWAERFLFTHVGRWPRGDDPKGFKVTNCSVRHDHWTLVSTPARPKPKGFASVAADPEPEWQLFDLKADPGETTDVSAAHPDVVARMSKAYDAWWESVLPGMENENAPQPAENPYKTWFHEQFGPNASAKPDHPLPAGS